MRLLLSIVVVAFLVPAAPVAGVPASAKQKGKKQAKYEHVEPVRTTSIHVVFSTHDLRVIRQHYEPRYRNLPPGLRKKYARTGQLPPGWQKKMEPFPVVVERELVVLPSGYRRGVIDGNAVIYNPHTHVIVDVAVLF